MITQIKSAVRQFFLGMSVKDFAEIGLFLIGLVFFAATMFGWLPVWQSLIGALSTIVAFCLVQFASDVKILSIRIQ